MKILNTVQDAIKYSYSYLINTGRIVKAKKWQGIDSPQDMFEALDLSFKCPMPTTRELAESYIKPNMPWAEDHFQERVGGSPLNPPPSHEKWPFGKKNNEAFTSNEKFDHTYPERFWPKYAGDNARFETMIHHGPEYDTKARGTRFPNEGIRFELGDLGDVINQLSEDPLTRQAYLPIFFPEDTGAKGGKGRVPCTLGYHFIIRDGYLHVTYLMRSCDALRHFRDDIYMAVRLTQFITQQLWLNGSEKPISVGMLKFYATSYHVFSSEEKLLHKNI